VKLVKHGAGDAPVCITPCGFTCVHNGKSTASNHSNGGSLRAEGIRLFMEDKSMAGAAMVGTLLP